MACDFCSWGDPIWSYPCKDFESGEVHIPDAAGGGTNVSMQSFKNWLACEECSNLIEEENFKELLNRAVISAIPEERWSQIPPARQADLKRWISDTHIKFMQNRTGPREPCKEEVKH